MQIWVWKEEQETAFIKAPDQLNRRQQAQAREVEELQGICQACEAEVLSIRVDASALMHQSSEAVHECLAADKARHVQYFSWQRSPTQMISKYA